MKLILALLLFCSFAAVTGSAQSGGSTRGIASAYTPEKGSTERKAILDALRLAVTKQLKQPVVFKLDHLKVKSGWAFLLGKPQTPTGEALDYKGTVYQDTIEAGAFDDGICALLHSLKGRWKVVTFVIGATDVPYVEWDKTYGAPRAIFPFNELSHSDRQNY
jgi:hypothetical protein